MIKSSRVIVAITLFSALLSFFKFNNCSSDNWAAPDVYIKMCYSDITALYGARDIDQKVWPYQSSENAIEYPVITGLVIWFTSLPVDNYQNFFYLNIFLLALLFLAVSFLIYRIRAQFAPLFILAPAVIASLYINWDLWAVLGAILAIYLFKEHHFDYSAIALGVAIATKFFPVVLLIPVALFFLNQRKIKELIRFKLILVITWLAINLPVALTSPGWSRFYKMNLERGNDLGSVWFALELLGINIATPAILVIGFILLLTLIYFARSLRNFEQFIIITFLFIALFVTVSKVYSPQYVLWLTPIAIIAMTQKKERSAYWIWQGGEAFYHFAIWQYLALASGAKYGLSEGFYAIAILIRVATLAWFARALIHSYPRSNFTLSESGDSLTHLHPVR
jgi:uncharacterized membrane protein